MLTSIMIGNKISEARKKQNLSQTQLAQRLSISSQAVGKWERGESMPDIITFNRLAEELGVDLNYFSENFESAQTEKARAKPTEEQPNEFQDQKPTNKLSWDMSKGNWTDADFSGLKNLHDKFNASNMQRCLFVDSDMSQLLLRGNNVENCDFSNSDMSNCRIQGSNLVNTIFQNCSLEQAQLSGNNIKACNFTGANFTKAIIKWSSLLKNTVTGAVWNGTQFNGSQFSDMLFDCVFEECVFAECAFKNVTFQNAVFVNTFIKNTNLKKVKFINCKADKITYAFLKTAKANMEGITLIES